MMDGATNPRALSTSGSSRRQRMNAIRAPSATPTATPPTAASANVVTPCPQVAAVPIAAASDTLYAVKAVASLSRLSPPSSVIMRRGSPSLRPTAVADTASGGATTAASVTAAATVNSGTVLYATYPTAKVVASGSPTASSPIGRMLRLSAT